MKPLQAIAVHEITRITEGLRPVRAPDLGWLRAVRETLALPRSMLAKRLRVSPSAVSSYESGEARGSISLSTLRRVADAMGCELVLGLVPKSGGTFAALAEANDPEAKHLRATDHSQALEGIAPNKWL